MNKLLILVGIALMTINSYAQIVNIPDANFKAALVANKKININQDSEIQTSEAQIFNGSIYVAFRFIENLEGIGEFVNLTGLDCSSNRQLPNLDLSKNLFLKDLNCSQCNLKDLDLSSNLDLNILNCGGNFLSNLDLSKNTKLTSLECSMSNLTALDVSKNSKLVDLSCVGSNLTTLNLDFHPDLVALTCSSNQISSLNLRLCYSLQYIQCSNNKLTSLDLSQNQSLTGLVCFGNLLTSLDVSKNKSFTYLNCIGNELPYVCINEDQIIYTSDWIKNSETEWNSNCDLTTNIVDKRFQHTPKTLTRIFTPLGQELQPNQVSEGLYIYQYSDGSIDKVMKQ